MLNYIWGGIVVVSIICSIATGRIDQVSNAVIDGANDAIKLTLSLAGMMCFFSGIMKVAERAGVTNFLAKAFAPVLSRLFPDYDRGGKAFKAICMNVTANLLGLGNAATPFGISAMKHMAESDKSGQYRKNKVANNSMVMFVVLNSASIQLIPTTIAVLRHRYGAENPFDVVPAIWISSTITLIVGVVIAKILEKKGMSND